MSQRHSLFCFIGINLIICRSRIPRLRRSLKRGVDWSRIDKNEYLAAMRESVVDSSHIKTLLKGALTGKIKGQRIFPVGDGGDQEYSVIFAK